MQVAYSRNVSHPPAALPHAHPNLNPQLPTSHSQAGPFSHPQLQQQQQPTSAHVQPHLRSGTLKHVSSSSGSSRKPGGVLVGVGAQGPLQHQYTRPNSTGDTFELDADTGFGGGVTVGLDGRVHYYRAAQITSPAAIATAPFQILASPPPQYAQPQQFGYPPPYPNSSNCRPQPQSSQQYANPVRQGCAQMNGASRTSGVFVGECGAGGMVATLTRSFEEASKDPCSPSQQPVVVHNSNSAGHLQHYAAPSAATNSVNNAAAVLYQNLRSLSGPNAGTSSTFGNAGKRQLGHQLSQGSGARQANGSCGQMERKGQLLEDFTQYLSSQPQYQNVGDQVQVQAQSSGKHHAAKDPKEAAPANLKEGRNRASFAGGSSGSGATSAQQGTLPRNGSGLGTLPRRDRTSSAKLNQGSVSASGPNQAPAVQPQRSASHGSGMSTATATGTATLGRTKHSTSSNSNQSHTQTQAQVQATSAFQPQVQPGMGNSRSASNGKTLSRLSIASVGSTFSGRSACTSAATTTTNSATLTGSLTATTCSSPPTPASGALGHGFGRMSSSATTASSNGTARSGSGSGPNSSSNSNSRPTTLLDAGLRPRPHPAPAPPTNANGNDGHKGAPTLADECDHFRKVVTDQFRNSGI